MFGNARRWIPLFQNFLNLLYPRFCLECNASIEKGALDPVPLSSHFCSPCWRSIRPLKAPACPICAAPFPSRVALSQSPDHRCGECREDPPAFSRAVTPFAYEGAMIKAIQFLKYNKGTTLAEPLARLLVEELKTLTADRIMAIPLHPGRLRSREYNQSLLLAKEVSKLSSLPLLIDTMTRVRETPPQVGLSKKERKENIRRAFSVARPGQIKNQRILLIDDVYTTGATLREGAKTLIRAGAKEVTVAALARML